MVIIIITSSEFKSRSTRSYETDKKVLNMSCKNEEISSDILVVELALEVYIRYIQGSNHNLMHKLCSRGYEDPSRVRIVYRKIFYRSPQ